MRKEIKMGSWDVEKRKLFTVGRDRTLAIRLPVEWVKSHGLRTGDHVLLYKERDKLTIRKMKTSPRNEKNGS
ncbi:MAG: AbrB/MazE/SpoVT family DNA-binding domain-containing protein [Candidatus Bathyarchaeota archaeon]|jgi:hypothetical protein